MFGPLTVPARENRSEMHEQPNFYWNQESHLRALQKGKAWSWSILRPVLIVGFSTGSAMNVIPALGVYAALRRESGLDLPFPGGAPRVAQAIDADLLARVHRLGGRVAKRPQRDFQRHQRRRVRLGKYLAGHRRRAGHAAGRPTCRSRSTARSARARPSGKRSAPNTGFASGNLRDFVGLSFEYADYTMGFGRNEPGPPAIVSTIKLMQAGFTEVIDTEAMFVKFFAEFQVNRLLPPV